MFKKFQNLVIFFSVLMALVLSSCSESKKENNLSGEPANIPIPATDGLVDRPELFLTFADNSIQGKEGSNIFSLAMANSGVLTNETCPCDDMECWRETTNRESLEQFKCAKDALGAAGFSQLTLIADVYDLVSALESADDLLAVEKITKIALTVTQNKNAGDCDVSIHTALNQLRIGLSSLNSLSSGLQKDNIRLALIPELYSNTTTALTAITAMARFADSRQNSLISCIGDENSKHLIRIFGLKEKLTKKLATIADKLFVIGTIGTCALKIINGVAVLADNTACAIEDFQALIKSFDAIEDAFNKTLPPGGAQPPLVGVNKLDICRADEIIDIEEKYGKLCYGRPATCNTWAMGLYGIQLERGFRDWVKFAEYEDNSIDGVTRLYAKYCAESCSSLRNIRNNKANELFNSDVDPSCYGFVKSGKHCEAAVAVCAANCCSDEMFPKGSCQSEAKKIWEEHVYPNVELACVGCDSSKGEYKNEKGKCIECNGTIEYGECVKCDETIKDGECVTENHFSGQNLKYELTYASKADYGVTVPYSVTYDLQKVVPEVGQLYSGTTAWKEDSLYGNPDLGSWKVTIKELPPLNCEIGKKYNMIVEVMEVEEVDFDSQSGAIPRASVSIYTGSSSFPMKVFHSKERNGYIEESNALVAARGSSFFTATQPTSGTASLEVECGVSFPRSGDIIRLGNHHIWPLLVVRIEQSTEKDNAPYLKAIGF